MSRTHNWFEHLGSIYICEGKNCYSPLDNIRQMTFISKIFSQCFYFESELTSFSFQLHICVDSAIGSLFLSLNNLIKVMYLFIVWQRLEMSTCIFFYYNPNTIFLEKLLISFQEP